MNSTKKNIIALRLVILGGLAICALVGPVWAQVVTTFPFNDDFEGQSQAQASNACGVSVPLASPWTNATDDDIDWTPDSGGTPSLNTGPSMDQSPGTASGIYLYTEASSPCFNSTARLLSPQFDISAFVNPPSITYSYHMRLAVEDA